MTGHTAEYDALREQVERHRLVLNSTPWWRPFKRQAAAREYRLSLLMGALWELRHRVTPPGVPALNVCPPCAQALHDLCTRALAPCDCPEHEGEA